MPEVRCCRKCGEEKPPTEFHRHKSSKDGLRTQCKACVRAYNAVRNPINNPKRYSRAKQIVYFVRSGDYVKIGHSRNFRIRLSELQIGNPYGLEILWTEAGGPKEEGFWHHVFGHRYHRGEWFLFPKHSTSGNVPQE